MVAVRSAGRRTGAHGTCWWGADGGPVPCAPGGRSMGGAAAAPRGKRPVGVPAPDAEESRARRGENRVEDALADAVVKAVQDTGGYGGAVYLRSRDRRSLVLCVMSGVPRSLLKPWWRIPVSGALPMCEAFRSGETLYLPDDRATMLRSPSSRRPCRTRSRTPTTRCGSAGRRWASSRCCTPPPGSLRVWRAGGARGAAPGRAGHAGAPRRVRPRAARPHGRGRAVVRHRVRRPAGQCAAADAARAGGRGRDDRVGPGQRPLVGDDDALELLGCPARGSTAPWPRSRSG